MIVRDGSRGGDSWTDSGDRSDQSRGDQFCDCRMPDGLDVRTAQRDIVKLQNALRSVVGKLHSPLRVNDDHSFEHPRENRLHPTAIARLLGKPSGDLVHRFVKRPRDVAQFVVAEIDSSRRQVPGPVTTGHGNDAVHPSSDPNGGSPRDERRSEECRSQRAKRCHQRRSKVRRDVGHRQRHTDKSDCRVGHPCCDVQHVDIQRVAVTRRPPDVPARAASTSGRCAWFSISGKRRKRLRRITQDDAVVRNESDTSVRQGTESIGFRVQLGRCARLRTAPEQVGNDPGLGDKRGLYFAVDLATQHHGEQGSGNDQSEPGRSEGCQEEPALKASDHGASTSL